MTGMRSSGPDTGGENNKKNNNLGLQISINSNTDKLYDKKITNLSLRFESKIEEAISNKVFPNRLSQFDLSNPIR
jgi:hypothetical protein